jgi:hypothetical protein
MKSGVEATPETSSRPISNIPQTSEMSKRHGKQKSIGEPSYCILIRATNLMRPKFVSE